MSRHWNTQVPYSLGPYWANIFFLRSRAERDDAKANWLSRPIQERLKYTRPGTAQVNPKLKNLSPGTPSWIDDLGHARFFLSVLVALFIIQWSLRFEQYYDV